MTEAKGEYNITLATNNNSLSGILPDDWIVALQQDGATYSKNLWKLGDWVNIIDLYVTQSVLPFTREDICRFVGSFFGVRSRTARNYADLARDYDPDRRELYEVLPFSHLLMARSYEGRTDEILRYDLAETDRRGGKPPSVEWLEQAISKIVLVLLPDNFIGDPQGQLDEICQSDDTLTDPGRLPGEDEPESSGIVMREYLTELITTVRRLVKRMGLDDKKQTRAEHLLDLFEEVLKGS